MAAAELECDGIWDNATLSIHPAPRDDDDEDDSGHRGSTYLQVLEGARDGRRGLLLRKFEKRVVEYLELEDLEGDGHGLAVTVHMAGDRHGAAECEVLAAVWLETRSAQEGERPQSVG